MKRSFQSAYCFRSLAIGLLGLCLWACGSDKPRDISSSEIAEVQVPKEKYGFNFSNFSVIEGTFNKGQVLGDLLLAHGIDYGQIVKIEKDTREVFDVRRIRPGDPYTLFCALDSIATAQYLVIETSVSRFVTYTFGEQPTAIAGEKPVELVLKTGSGEIQSSLSKTIADMGLSPELAFKLSDMYAWTIDFYRLQKGDHFRVCYEERFIDGAPAGMGRILAAEFWHRDERFASFRFTNDEVNDFYNEKGESLRKAFLKSPLKFSKITSSYSLKRFHPVQKRWKAHLGTDYGAPTGTPILATANGTIIEAAQTKYNGKYVKIKHNSTYTTQYLHMSKLIARKGQVVRQGDVIGLVGSTGLATGPHVCYRFWKNGKQEDPYKQNLPKSEPLPAKYMNAFALHRDSLLQKLEDAERPKLSAKSPTAIKELL